MNMNQAITRLQKNIEPLRLQIINHPVYGLIKDKDDLKIFMQFHVYAVWDFMSLLKTLQNELTCTRVPWFPVGNADTRFLINEIVVGEEADIDFNGVRKSHFELYLSAMEQCGANTSQIDYFIKELKASNNFELAFQKSETPAAAQEFVNFTFEIINSKKAYLQSAIFTFGREDLIPGMFLSLVNDMHQTFPNEIAIFKYYLERHIEVDGDHHSHLALQMTANLCSDNVSIWEEVEQATITSLQKRIALWNGVYQTLKKRHSLPTA